MKLRTRLSLIAGGLIFASMAVSGGLILGQCYKAMMAQAMDAAYHESREAFSGFEQYQNSLDGRMSAELGAFYLKSRQDDYTILLEDGEAVYNNTLLDPGELSVQERYYNGWPYQARLFMGRRLLVFSRGVMDDFSIYHVCDVTETYLRLYGLAAQIGVISLAVTAGAIAALFLTLRRGLRPLQDLSQAAGAIAEGAYGRRAPEDRRDEIGSLGRDFNRMAGAVQRHIRQVEESEEKKTLFMASLTHELKTPLTAISGYAQTLRAAKLRDEDRDAALGYIYQESQRLDRLSKKMLRLLELDRDVPLSLEPVSIQELFDGAVRTCGPMAEANHTRLEIGGCPGVLEADRDLMTQVIINLLDNAIKAAPGGLVRLSAKDGVLIVEDNGRGIPQEEIGRLTEPFYMVDKSRSRKSGGAGLGLALSAAILRRHNMSMRIESRLGEGTKISVFTI